MSTGVSPRRARLHPLPRRSRPVSTQDQCIPPPPPLQGGLEPRPASCTPHICGPPGPARSKTKLCPWVVGSFRPCEAETPTAAASTTLGPPRVRPRLQAPCPRPHLFKAALGPADAWRVGVGSQHSGMCPYPLTRTGMSRGQRARDQGPGCSVHPRAPAHLQWDVWGPPCTSTQGPAGPDYLQFASSPRSPQPARLPPSAPPASAIHDARDQPLALGSKTLLSRLFPRGGGGGAGAGHGHHRQPGRTFPRARAEWTVPPQLECPRPQPPLQAALRFRRQKGQAAVSGYLRELGVAWPLAPRIPRLPGGG